MKMKMSTAESDEVSYIVIVTVRGWVQKTFNNYTKNTFFVDVY